MKTRFDLDFSNFCARYLLVENSKTTSLKERKFKMKEYLRCEEALSLLKLKVKMSDLIANYKGKYTDLLCRGRGSHEENIERLLDCPNFYQIPKIGNYRKM